MRKRIAVFSLAAALILCIMAAAILLIKRNPYDITPSNPDNYTIHVDFGGEIDWEIPQEHDVSPYINNGYRRSWTLVDNYEDYKSLVETALSCLDTQWEVTPDYVMLKEDIFEENNVLVVKSLECGSYRYYPQLTSCTLNQEKTSCQVEILAYSPAMCTGDITGAVFFLPVPKTVTEVTLEHETCADDYEGWSF